MSDPNYGFSGIFPIAYPIEDNVQRALSFQRTHSPAEVVEWFYDTVRNNADGHLSEQLSMDFKQINPIFADFGNYNYGVIGKALGFPDWILEHGAGYAQGKADGLTKFQAIMRSLFEGIGNNGKVTVNGDNAEDQILIDAGIAAAKDNGVSNSDLEL